jgi:methionyl-tRNA formyltransferase
LETDVGRLIIWRAEADPGGPASQPVARFDETGFATGDGAHLRLREVQPAGGNRMSWDAFVRGRPSIVGSSIVP